MKTTIDLPEPLLKKLKLRALREGRKMKELAREFLEQGLAKPLPSKSPARPVIVKHKKSGLPVVQGPPLKPGQRTPTPEEIANILNDQEVEWMLGSS